MNYAAEPTQAWRMVRRGWHETRDGRLYVSRIRGGWEYGKIEDGVPYAIGDTTRTIARAKVLAERGGDEYEQREAALDYTPARDLDHILDVLTGTSS